MIYVTSDFHFNHQNPFIYESRGFDSVEEMSKILVHNYNEIITPEDDVYILGDNLLGGPENLENGIDTMRWLKGKLHLIRGNHDTNKKWEAYKTLYNVVEMENSLYLKYEGYHFYLSHFPTLCSNYDDKGLKHCIINLCGHSHTRDKFVDMDKGLIYHCEVDCQNNMPVSIEQIIKELKKYRKLHCAESIIND